MRFLLYVGIALVGVSSVSAACIPKTASIGATACVQVQSNALGTDIISHDNNPVTITVPKFDTSANPGAVLDAVWLNWIGGDYIPDVHYQVNSDTSNFIVSVFVANSWGLRSTVDNAPVSNNDLSSTGALSGKATVTTGFGTGATGCPIDTDSQIPPHTQACATKTGIEWAQFQLSDTTYNGAGKHLTSTSVQAFSPDYSQFGTYTDFVGNPGTPTNGVRLTSGTPNPGYSSSSGGTWGLTTATADGSTPFAVLGTFGGGGTGGQLTITVNHFLEITLEVQYDFHFPASGNGDPQFVGFQGQSFQVHGAPDSYFALISAPSYYVNARFDYISTGSCTYNETACFTHAGTYMGMIYVGMKDANILIQAGPHATGFAGILVNDKPMTTGDRFVLSGISGDSYIQVLSKSKLILSLDNIVVTVHNSDNFINFDLSLTDKELLLNGAVKHVVPNGATPSQIQHHINKWYGSYNPLHGLIGQTWRNVKYQDNKLFQGDITEYQLDKIIDHTFLYCVYEA